MCVVTEQLCGVLFVLPYMGLKGQIRASRLCGKYHYLTSHLNTLRCHILIQ